MLFAPSFGCPMPEVSKKHHEEGESAEGPAGKPQETGETKEKDGLAAVFFFCDV